MAVDVTPLLPVPIPHTKAMFARGIRAGRWVFATGLSGTDYKGGLAAEVLAAGHPLNGEPQGKREARRLFKNAGEVLAAAGASFADVVRVDQYYTSPDAVPPYHEVRREVFKGKIPPSTSTLQRRLVHTGQSQVAQMIGVVPGSGLEARHADYGPLYQIHHTSGYSPGLAAGDYRFIPGQTAEARDEAIGGIDPEARRPAGLWKGTPIKLETNFIITRKLAPALEAAGAGLDTVVKAQVYLRDPNDVPAFNEAWLEHFPEPPATSIIPVNTPGFIQPEERIEINTISLAKTGATKRMTIRGPKPPLYDGHVNAVRAGDLLFLSGLMALDGGKLVKGGVGDERQPFFGIPVKAQLEAIIAEATAICETAGTSLANAVRIQQFHSDLADLPAAIEAWSDAMGGAPLPLSAVEVAWLPVPGARVLCDIWVYAPQ